MILHLNVCKKLLAHIQDFRRPRYQNQLDSHYSQEIIEAVWFADQATVVLLLSTTSTCTTPSRKNLLDCGQEQLQPERTCFLIYHSVACHHNIFLFRLFLVIFICKFGETCAILFSSSTSWHTKANIFVEKRPFLYFTLFCCVSAFKKS